jgi:hypothetical protein
MTSQIIHIGIHKTSSTFLQTKVFPKYPKYDLITRPDTQQDDFFNLLQYADESFLPNSFYSSFQQKYDLTGRNLIISDEGFSGKPLGYAYLNRSIIAQRLKRLVPGAEIVIFIRDQKDIIKSHYNSYVKMPFGVKSIEDFIWMDTSDSDHGVYNENSLTFNTNDYYLNVKCFEYSKLIQLYQSLFEKVHVFLFEEMISNSSEVVKRINSILHDEFEFVPDDDRTNKSLSSFRLGQRRFCNKLAYLFDNRSIKRVIQNSYRAFPDIEGPGRIGAKIELNIGDYYTMENIALKRLLPAIKWDCFPNKYS